MRHGHVSRSMFNVRLTFLSGRTLSLWVGSRPLGCRALLHLFFGGGANCALPADALTSCLLGRFAWHAGCSRLFVCLLGNLFLRRSRFGVSSLWTSALWAVSVGVCFH